MVNRALEFVVIILLMRLHRLRKNLGSMYFSIDKVLQLGDMRVASRHSLRWVLSALNDEIFNKFDRYPQYPRQLCSLTATTCSL